MVGRKVYDERHEDRHVHGECHPSSTGPPAVRELVAPSPETAISHEGTAFHMRRALMEATYVVANVVTGGVWPERDEPSATS